MDPLSLMPVDEVAVLRRAGRAARHLCRDAERQIGSVALRGPVVFEAHRARPGLSPSRTRVSRERSGGHGSRPNEDGLAPPEGQLEEAPNLSQIDRSYWLSGNPLPVTEQNLYRGKEVFLDRCVGCHGEMGDGKGPGASFLRPFRPTSPTRTTRAVAATPGRATSTTESCAAGPGLGWRISATASRSTTSGASSSS